MVRLFRSRHDQEVKQEEEFILLRETHETVTRLEVLLGDLRKSIDTLNDEVQWHKKE